MAEPGTKPRRKLAVILQSLVDFKLLIPSTEFQPSVDHFKGIRIRTNKVDYCLVEIIPKLNRDIVNQEDLDVLEFLTRNFFIHSRTRWVEVLK